MNEEIMADWNNVFKPSNEVFAFRLLWMAALTTLLVGLYFNAAAVKGSFFPPMFSRIEGRIENKELRFVNRNKRMGHYCGFVSYSYSVGNSTYQNDLIDFVGHQPCAEDEDVAASLIEKYEIGSNVTVYYDAKSPRFSVLRPKETMRGLDLWIPPILLSLTMVSAAMTSFYKRKTRKLKAEFEKKHGFKW